MGILGLLYLVLLLSCLEQKDIAGTATGTENTIAERNDSLAGSNSVLTGTVVSDQGEPVSGVRVLLKTTRYIPADILEHDGKRTFIPSDSGLVSITDHSGRYTFHIFADSLYFLEVNGPDPASAPGDSARISNVSWISEVRVTAPGDTQEIGPAILVPSGTLKGRIALQHRISGQTQEPNLLWVGIQGTSNFVRADSMGQFTLGELAAGSHDLSIIRTKSVSNSPGKLQNLEMFTISGWTIFPGKVSILDTVFLTDKPTVACLEDPRELREDSGETYLFTRQDRVLRTLRLNRPPALVELDLCLGLWREKTPLPRWLDNDTRLFSSGGLDYVHSQKWGDLLRIDSLGLRVDSLIAPQPRPYMATGEAGRFYSAESPGGEVRHFQNEADFLGTLNYDVLPGQALPPSPASASGIAAMAAARGILYYLDTTSAGLIVQGYDIEKMEFGPTHILEGFSGDLVGATVTAAGELVLLDDMNVLWVYSAHSGEKIRTLRILSSLRLVGLTASLP